MRFQQGIRFPYPRRPRGPGRGDPPYRMSHAAYLARLRNLSRWNRPRAPIETQRLRIEIALGALRGEEYRAIARRLGCSHVYCRKVALGYRAGRMPFLPPDMESLAAMRESLSVCETAADTALAESARANMAGGEDETAFFPQAFQPAVRDEQPFTTAADTEREAQKMIRETHRKSPGLQPMTWQEHEERRRRRGRRVLSSVRLR